MRIRSAHLEILEFPMGMTSRDIFARFKTMQRKQNFASVLGIQKEIGDNHAFFRDN